MKWLVLAACCTIVVACAMGSNKAAAPLAMAGHEAPIAAGPSNSHGDIEQLDQQITAQMAQGKFVVTDAAPACVGAAACGVAMRSAPQPLALTDPSCHPAKTEACNTSCTLSGSICENAEKICNLAKDMAGDDWAANKCKSARESCASANQTCCSCML